MSLNTKKLLYSIELVLALVYLYILVEEVRNPGMWGKSTTTGDTDNSRYFIFLELFQVDILVILLIMVPMSGDIASGQKIFLPGIAALAIYALANTIYLVHNVIIFDPQYKGVTLIMAKVAIELVFLIIALVSWLKRYVDIRL